MNLIEQIDHWALAAPNAIAHISGDKRLTYGELRRRSDALAAHLTKRFGNRSPIAVLGHLDPEMLIAFLGAVKSRRPYVPLDTVLPQQRIDKILAISRPALLLMPEDVTELSSSAPLVPATRVQRDDPFYILFTSGSTGEPKGVIITLGCLEHFVAWMLGEPRAWKFRRYDVGFYAIVCTNVPG
ncbi:MAG: hypothetical protein DMF38_09765 [Verrucomicrobia bacterium]|nr:MAG: hypothetical protein DMF38_09765 [Verrucomicrobiota bacterium]